MGKVICFECGNVNNYEMRREIRKYEGDGYSFEMEVELPFCKTCGTPVVCEEIEEEIARRANAIIRKERDVLSKEEILELLNRYNVSQKFMSRLLGWGEITLSRYILKGYAPNKENSDKLRTLRNPYIFQKYLNDIFEQTKGEIKSEKSFEKAQERVNSELQKYELEKGKIYSAINWFLGEMSQEVPLTHLALQKLLYFVQSWSVAINGEWMFEDECQAWVHGAVYPQVYETFKYFGYGALPKVNVQEVLDEKDLYVLRMVKKYYYDVYNAKTLEKICHLEAPWEDARIGYVEDAKSREIISKERIKAYYCQLARRYGVDRENTAGVKAYLSNILY